MATTGIGRVVPLLRGEYDPTRTYELNDIVSLNGSLYWHYSHEVTTNVAPQATSTWKVVLSLADAEGYIARAETAAEEAESAKDDAVTAKNAAETASTTATEASEAATAAKDDAVTARNAAQTAETGAVEAKNAAVSAKDDAVTAASSANTSATNAGNSAGTAQYYAENAGTAAELATAKAGEASASATTASSAATTATEAKNTAVSSATTATTKAGEASTSATSAASSAAAAQAVKDSIPQDYTALSEDVSDLKKSVFVQSTPTLQWVQGNINATTGKAVNSTTRLRGVLFIYASGKLLVPAMPSGYKIFTYKYSGPSENDYIDKGRDGWDTEAFELDGGYYYRFVTAYTDDSTITPENAPDIAMIAINVTDTTLTQPDKAADAKTVGDIFAQSTYFRRALTSSDDLNDITQPGVYVCSKTNLPANTPKDIGGTLVVYSAPNTCNQIFISQNSNGSGFHYRCGGLPGQVTNNWLELYTPGVSLNAQTDLDSITDPGTYHWPISNRPINSPVQSAALMVVYRTPVYIAQMVIGTSETYFRLSTVRAENGWYAWIGLNNTGFSNQLPVLALTGDTTGMSKDDAVTMDYSVFGQTGTATVKWQGSSSLRYAKKNYTIKLDNGIDGWNKWATFVNSLRAANGNISRVDTTSRWGTQTKFCTKGNWVDASASKNIVSARLWGQIVKNRVTSGGITDNRKDAPNYGAIDGFPVEIQMNGKSLGLYTFNIPKDKWLFDMGTGSAEYVVSGEDNNSAACRWKATALVDGTDFDVEYAPDGVENSTVAASLNAAISAAINAGENWETELAPFVDIDSVFDYFVFTCCISNHDALARNILYGTYDGVKWFMSAYDMDTTYGADQYGSMWRPVVTDKTQFAQAATIHRLAYLMYTYSKPKLKARYQELRSTILSDENVWHEFSNFIVDIPQRCYDINNDLWPTMPGTATQNMAQFMDFYRMHCAYLDKEIEAMS